MALDQPRTPVLSTVASGKEIEGLGLVCQYSGCGMPADVVIEIGMKRTEPVFEVAFCGGHHAAVSSFFDNLFAADSLKPIIESLETSRKLTYAGLLDFDKAYMALTSLKIPDRTFAQLGP